MSIIEGESGQGHIMRIRATAFAKAAIFSRQHAQVRAARRVCLAVRRIEAANAGTAHTSRELAREFGRTTEPGQSGSYQLFMY